MKEIHLLPSRYRYLSMDDRNIPDLMEELNDLADNLVYTVVGEMSSRLIDRIDRKELKEVMNGFFQDYKLGQIPIRRRPKPKNKETSTQRDPNLSDVIRETRSRKNKELTWNNCKDVRGIPPEAMDMVYCKDDILNLVDDCVLMGEYDDDGIVVICGIMNYDFKVRFISEKESKYFKRFNLGADKSSIKKNAADLEFFSL